MGMKSSMKASMKAMKAIKAMKAMKAMKSKIAKGKLAKSLVFRGSREKTSGGLSKDQLTKNKSGKVVSKLSSAASRKRYAGSKLQKWAKACTAAKKALGITGFVAINGKSPQGKALYAKAKALFSSP